MTGYDPLANARLAVEHDPVRGSGHGRLVLTPLDVPSGARAAS